MHPHGKTDQRNPSCGIALHQSAMYVTGFRNGTPYRPRIAGPGSPAHSAATADRRSQPGWPRRQWPRDTGPIRGTSGRRGGSDEWYGGCEGNGMVGQDREPAGV